MQFHPKALLVTLAAGVILWLAINVRFGVAAVLALAALDAFGFLTPIGFFQGSTERSETKQPK
jgi:hypothetical protein